MGIRDVVSAYSARSVTPSPPPPPPPPRLANVCTRRDYFHEYHSTYLPIIFGEAHCAEVLTCGGVVHQRQDDFGERSCEYVNRRGEDENAEIGRQALQSYSKREGDAPASG